MVVTVVYFVVVVAAKKVLNDFNKVNKVNNHLIKNKKKIKDQLFIERKFWFKTNINSEKIEQIRKTTKKIFWKK